MESSIIIFFAIFLLLTGPFVGSFLALLVDRKNTSKAVTHKYRSQCLNCGHVLRWYDLVPLLSYALLRGRCRYCGKPIDIRLWFAEVLGLIAFSSLALLGLKLFIEVESPWLGLAQLLILFVFILFLLYSAIYDLLTMTIEGGITSVFLLVSLILSIVLNILNLLGVKQVEALTTLAHPEHLLAALVGAVALWLLIRISNQRAMGEGDIYIVAIMGLYLGGLGLGFALYMAVVVGGIFGVLYALKLGKLKGILVPFVPFLLIGSSLSIMLGKELIQILFYVSR